MSISAHLLRMLEPTVRPGNLPAPNSASSSTPLESQSFEQLLAGAQENLAEGLDVQGSQEIENSAEATQVSKAAEQKRILPELTGLDRIENASLRLIFEQRDDIAKG